ncbi:MAG: DinB family protein [Planctomycetota bacterium]
MSATHPTAREASELRDYLVSELLREQPATRRVIEAMPDKKLGYRPEPRLMDFVNLALHLAQAGHYFADFIEKRSASAHDGGDDTRVVPHAAVELAREVDRLLALAVDRFRHAPAERLAHRVEFKGFGAFPGVTFIQWHLSHLIHHRAQLGMYLRMAGERVPPIYGPTADGRPTESP